MKGCRKINILHNVNILNPKKYTSKLCLQISGLFPYYAGYSPKFMEQLLRSLPLPDDIVIFDPWNGSGITTRIAHSLGFKAIGQDLNPVMVIVAKAGLISSMEASSLVPLAESIIKQVKLNPRAVMNNDPLCKWLSPQSASYVRRIETEINGTLILQKDYQYLAEKDALSKISPLAALFYVALFRSLRYLLREFISKNPTWIKIPKNSANHKKLALETITDQFIREIECLAKELFIQYEASRRNFPIIELGNAEQLCLKDNSIDVIISSPPYCTRIDYAVATSIELALLRINKDSFDMLRRSLTGTSAIKQNIENINKAWGKTCLQFLKNVYFHSSRASKNYYFKSHVQYFNSIFLSLKEIARVLTSRGKCILVVQDSFYKEIHNDLPTIITEMAEHRGLELLRREDFLVKQSMVNLNHQARKYLSERKNVESVLCFELQ